MAKQESWMTMMVAPPCHCKQLSWLGPNRKSKNGLYKQRRGGHKSKKKSFTQMQFHLLMTDITYSTVE
jgi:hypothetical protein